MALLAIAETDEERLLCRQLEIIYITVQQQPPEKLKETIESHTAIIRFLRADAYCRLGAAYIKQSSVIEAEAAYEQCIQSQLPLTANDQVMQRYTNVKLEALEQLVTIYELRGKTALATQTRRHIDTCRRGLMTSTV
ncbi:hypothetical protein BDF19DRAFT_466341 [Syncephalis fuscata]|nr:hypothetical protein BDF19DRAFT_466341 [Syncephalis fuscata]